MDAQQPSPLTRRELLKRGAALGGALALGGVGSSAGVRAAQEPRFTGVTLNYMSHPGQILPIITHHLGYLREQYGLEIRILESPDPTSYLDAMRDLRTGGGRYDIVMHFPRYNGELAVTGYLRPLDDLIARYDAAPLFDNIVDAYRILYTQWEGKTIAVPVDGDVAMLYYRKDALENPDYRRRFREKYGFDLRVPRTWDEFIKVAEFFTGWTWGPTGKPGYGFQTSTWERAFIEQQWAPMMASAGGNWLTKEGAHPAFNNRAGVRALQDLKTLLGFARLHLPLVGPDHGDRLRQRRRFGAVVYGPGSAGVVSQVVVCPKRRPRKDEELRLRLLARLRSGRRLPKLQLHVLRAGGGDQSVQQAGRRGLSGASNPSGPQAEGPFHGRPAVR